MKNILTSLLSPFDSAKTRLTKRAIAQAEQVKETFSDLEKVIKEGGYVLEDHARATKDRDDFLRDNKDTQVDQNVGRNEDIKRASWLLSGVVLMCLIFSYKSVGFLFGTFYGLDKPLIILVVALAMAACIVYLSIYLHHFANRFREKSIIQFALIRFVAYAFILLLPLMNLFEGHESQYSQAAMALNVFVCFIDVAAHTALVTMSNVFIDTGNTRIAIALLKEKDKAMRQADLKLRALNGKFMVAKNHFANAAMSFVQQIKQLEDLDETAAKNVMYSLSNFIIWMINNKVFQNAVLKLHTNPDGTITIQNDFITEEYDATRRGFDQLCRINGYGNGSMNPPATLQESRQTSGSTEHSHQEQPDGSSTTQSRFAGNRPDEDANEGEHVIDDQNIPEYDQVFEESNQNDKFL